LEKTCRISDGQTDRQTVKQTDGQTSFSRLDRPAFNAAREKHTTIKKRKTCFSNFNKKTPKTFFTSTE